MQNYIRISCKVSDFLSLETIQEFQGNFKKRGKKEIEQIIISILRFGFSFPFFVWNHKKNNWCLDGHGRILALREMAKMRYFLNAEGKLAVDDSAPPSIPELPVVFIEAENEAEAKQKMLRLNSQYGLIDIDGFKAFIEGLKVDWGELALPSGDIFEFPDLSFDDNKKKESLAERFIIPPLSVFRCSSGYWQERKKAWLSLGIQSENGRDDAMLKNLAILAAKTGSRLPSESIFDPVLCEIIYRWFCPSGGQIFDPFAGGSVRGIVAGCLDYNYTGIDLRQEQIDANYEQIEIAPHQKPKWICADSAGMDNVLEQDFTCDLVFSCPPYADLEVYSDNPSDLSNMNYSDFQPAYFDIISKASSRLRNDSFAVFVVGEARSKINSGKYYGIIPDTIRAFESAGLHYYNEMILVTAIAAKALTVAEGFIKSRKIGKIHQNILVFVKGDPVKAAQKCKIEQQELIDAMIESDSNERAIA